MMWCHTADVRNEGAPRPAVRQDLLAGDGDRQRTADLLTRATARGYLGLAELDERLGRAWAARTTGDLSALEADLPAAVRVERDREEAASRARTAARAGLAAHVGTYLAVMLLLVVLWLVGGASGAGWYPWPVWPALGWGFAVAGHVRAARAPVVTPSHPATAELRQPARG